MKHFSEPSTTPTKEIIRRVLSKNTFKVPTFEFMEQIRTPMKPSTNNINLYKNFTQRLEEIIKNNEILKEQNQLLNRTKTVPSVEDATAIISLLKGTISCLQFILHFLDLQSIIES